MQITGQKKKASAVLRISIYQVNLFLKILLAFITRWWQEQANVFQCYNM